MTNLNLYTLLSNDCYCRYNVEIARELGSITAAIMLHEMASRLKFHLEHSANQLIEEDGGFWFYFTRDKCEERTALTRTQQENAIGILETKGLISKKLKGVPCRRYFKLNDSEILTMLGIQKAQSSLQETCQLDGQIEQTRWQETCQLDGGKPANRSLYKKNNKKENKERERIRARGQTGNGTPAHAPAHTREGGPSAPPPDGGPPPTRSSSSSFELFGEDKLVKLTKEQYSKLKEEMPKQIDALITQLNDYIASTGKRYKSHYHTLRMWYRRKTTAETTTFHPEFAKGRNLYDFEKRALEAVKEDDEEVEWL